MAVSLNSIAPPWLRDYDGKALWRDALAGIILAVLLVPQAMAYALLAGLPPETGLYAAIAPPLLYALIGQSAFVSTGPVALASLLVASAIGGSDLPPAEAAAIIAVETGALLMLLGFLRLGRLVNFVSDPALLGFTAAAAVLIAASQIPSLVGLESQRNGNLIDAVRDFLNAGPVDPATLALGGAALLLLLLGDRYAGPGLWRIGVHPPWRMALVKAIPLAVLAGAALVAAWAGLDVKTVAKPEGGLPAPGLAPADLDVWLALLAPSAVVAIIVFVTGTAVAKSLSSRRRRALNTSREAAAIGAANIAAGLTGGYAVGVSLSRSALVYESGARSPLATAFAALLIVPVILFGGSALSMLPEAALAALVISAVFGLVKLREINAVWRHSRVEGGVFAVTLLATLGFGVEWGLLTGALAGLAAYLWFSSVPRVTRVGLTDRDGIYRSVDREEVEVDTLPVLVVRFDRSLYFGNVGHCEDQLLGHLARHADAECLLLDMRSVNAVDASGIRMLTRLLDNLEEKRLKIGFAAVKAPVQQALETCAPARQAEHFLTVEEGVEKMRAACGGSESVRPASGPARHA